MKVLFNYFTINYIKLFHLLSQPQIQIQDLPPDGSSILHIAVDTLNLDMIKLIYEITHLSPDIQDYQNITPLHLSANHPEILKYFLSIPNINVNVQNFQKQTTLHLAVDHSNDKSVCLLLNHPMIDLNIKNIDNNTAFDLAVECELNESIQNV